jgi:hypothetical protein
MTTIHSLLIVASIREWFIPQLDMKNAFHNGELRVFTGVHHLGILSLRVWSVTFIASFMTLNRLLELGFSVLPL